VPHIELLLTQKLPFWNTLPGIWGTKKGHKKGALPTLENSTCCEPAAPHGLVRGSPSQTGDDDANDSTHRDEKGQEGGLTDGRSQAFPEIPKPMEAD